MKYTLKVTNLTGLLDRKTYTKAPESWKDLETVKEAKPEEEDSIELMRIDNSNVCVWMIVRTESPFNGMKLSDYFLIELQVDPKKSAANKVNIAREVSSDRSNIKTDQSTK